MAEAAKWRRLRTERGCLKVMADYGERLLKAFDKRVWIAFGELPTQMNIEDRGSRFDCEAIAAKVTTVEATTTVSKRLPRGRRLRLWRSDRRSRSQTEKRCRAVGRDSALATLVWVRRTVAEHRTHSAAVGATEGCRRNARGVSVSAGEGALLRRCLTRRSSERPRRSHRSGAAAVERGSDAKRGVGGAAQKTQRQPRSAEVVRRTAAEVCHCRLRREHCGSALQTTAKKAAQNDVDFD
jgi:hypothetical protein